MRTLQLATLSLLAFATSASTFGDEFVRMHITPFTQSKAFNEYLSGKKTYFLIQPEYGWSSDYTAEGVTLGYFSRPDSEDYRGATLFSAKLGRVHPEHDADFSAHLIHVAHQFNSDHDKYQATGAIFYWREEGFGHMIGGNLSIGSWLHVTPDDPGFYLSASANYGEMREDSVLLPEPLSSQRESALTTRGSAFSINVARSLSDTLRLEYDHTFASRFSGGSDWFLRISCDWKPGTQLRFSVAKGEQFLIELGFFLNSK